MILTSTSATYGVRSTSPATSSGVSGGINLGQPETQISLPTADVAWTGQVLLADPAGVVVFADIDINILTGTVTSATTWVAGVAQVETATIVAAAGCTTNGTMTLLVTSEGMAGSPLSVVVPLTTTTHTTAALIAAAARTALTANATIAARFTVSGTSTSVSLTRKPLVYKMAGGDVSVHTPDSTLNIAIPGGLGITAAAGSANTVLGTATQGTLHRDIDGKDWEGTTLPAIAAGKIGVLQVTSDAASTSLVYLESTAFGFRQMPLSAGGFVLVGASGLNSSMSSSLAITTATNEKSAFLTISVVGSSV